ncbi:hypothetical protein AXF42_Ash021367 [Apostasia shenzhenica]|uniref:Uncharacterized protein n=1 Tax=Apostasia shenzhenica TaxID=1088818 RepID=A0A2I0AY35_9ASPA|nr:hypothetical protein AXF42_Ash021367 [Apostasia shenzhenica]
MDGVDQHLAGFCKLPIYRTRRQGDACGGRQSYSRKHNDAFDFHFVVNQISGKPPLKNFLRINKYESSGDICIPPAVVRNYRSPSGNTHGCTISYRHPPRLRLRDCRHHGGAAEDDQEDEDDREEAAGGSHDREVCEITAYVRHAEEEEKGN